MTMEHGLDRFSQAGPQASPAIKTSDMLVRRDTDRSAASRVARLAWFELAAAATRRSLAMELEKVEAN